MYKLNYMLTQGRQYRHNFSETRWEEGGLPFDARWRERERETYRLLGVAPPTFHLGYGLAVDLMGELLVIMTETTGVDPPTAG